MYICQFFTVNGLNISYSTAYMMEERVQQIGQWWSSDMNKCQALVLPCSADKSIECAFPRSLYSNKPSPAINHFSQRDSVPTFTGPDRVALLANFTVVTMNNQEQFFFCQRYVFLSGDRYSPPRVQGPFLDIISTCADRVSMMARKGKPND